MKNQNGGTLGDRLNVVYLDLVRIRKLFGTPIEELKPFEKWGLFLAYESDSGKRDYVDKIVESEDGIMAADYTVKYMSEEDANWFRENSYFIAERDRNSAFHAATEKGLKQGRAQGAREKAIEAARNALAMNLTPEQASQITGLSLDEVIALQNGASLSDSATR